METPAKKNWLVGIITVLLLALVIETGFLISQLTSKSNEKKETIRTVESPYWDNQPASRPYRNPRAFRYHRTQDPWDSMFQELQRMQEEMNRVFGESFGRVMTSPAMQAPVASLLGRSDSPSFSPAIDLQETDEAYVVKADVPGLEKDKIQVSVSGNVLTIQGERREEKEKEDEKQGFYAMERSHGSFARSFTLPGPVDESAVAADYQNGVLTVSLPKLKGGEGREKKVAIT